MFNTIHTFDPISAHLTLAGAAVTSVWFATLSPSPNRLGKLLGSYPRVSVPSIKTAASRQMLLSQLRNAQQLRVVEHCKGKTENIVRCGCERRKKEKIKIIVNIMLSIKIQFPFFSDGYVPFRCRQPTAADSAHSFKRIIMNTSRKKTEPSLRIQIKLGYLRIPDARRERKSRLIFAIGTERDLPIWRIFNLPEIWFLRNCHVSFESRASYGLQFWLPSLILPAESEQLCARR